MPLPGGKSPGLFHSLVRGRPLWHLRSVSLARRGGEVAGSILDRTALSPDGRGGGAASMSLLLPTTLSAAAVELGPDFGECPTGMGVTWAWQ